MEKEQILNRLNDIYNRVDRLIADIINDDQAPKKGKKKRKKVSEEISKPLAEMGELNRELTVKQILERHQEQPQDDEHIESVAKCVQMHDITAEQLEDALDRVKDQYNKGKVKEIRTYTYGALHRINTAA